jgi:hypothetical protein
MKKTIAALLALAFGIVLAIAFAPLPRSTPSIPVPPVSYAAPYYAPEWKQLAQEKRLRPKPQPVRPDSELKKSTWWKCDPSDPHTIFQGMKENVQTFGTEKPEDMGYKNCVKNPDIGDEEGAHPL